MAKSALQETSSPDLGGILLYTIVVPIVVSMPFGMMDAASGAWRGVTHTDYDLTPTDCVRTSTTSTAS